MALRVEDALLSGTELAGILLDHAKCFDRLPHAIMLRLASESRASDRPMAPIRSMCSHLRRRFIFCGGVGEVFQATNGSCRAARSRGAAELAGLGVGPGRFRRD